jgi:hypothetical protein
MNTNANWLRPCLVLGTGFHRWVLGESMQDAFRPLLDWNELLLAVARDLHVPLDRTAHSLSLNWEHLLTIARRSRGFEATPDGRRLTPPIGQLELIAKKSAAAILRKLKAAYPADTLNEHFPLQTSWGAVVSLNFDAHWLAGAAPSWASVLKDEGDLTSVRGSGKSLGSKLLRLNCHFTP